MASRYRGNLDAARRTYKTVVDEVKVALEKAEPQHALVGQQSYIRALRARLANSRERRADCELYSGAASDGKVNLSLATGYNAARTTADDWSDSVVMGYNWQSSCPTEGKVRSGCPRCAGSRQAAGVGDERREGYPRARWPTPCLP